MAAGVASTAATVNAQASISLLRSEPGPRFMADSPCEGGVSIPYTDKSILKSFVMEALTVQPVQAPLDAAASPLRSLRLRDSSNAFRFATACSWLMALGLGARGFGGLRVGVCAAGVGERGNSTGPPSIQSSPKWERGM